MFTYQLRPRVFRIENGDSLPFPNSAEILIVLGPLQPFGSEAGGGHTTVQSTGAQVEFNANTGEHFIVSKSPLSPLDVTIEEPDRRWELRGNELRLVIEHCETNQELTELIESLFRALPILLNVEFADPPVIERIEGKVGETRYRWELADWRMDFDVTTQEVQERKFVDSWQRIALLSDSNNRRLIGALHYFHIASRLRSAGHSPWEFTAESILNLTKTLETLFPPTGDGKKRDAVRRSLAVLEYSDEEIERDFIPVMALRDEIDVGHVDLSLYTRRQLNALHRYTQAADNVFSGLLQRLMLHMEKGSFTLIPHAPSSPDSVARRIIEKLERHFADRE